MKSVCVCNLHAKLLLFFDICKCKKKKRIHFRQQRQCMMTQKKTSVWMSFFCVLPGTRTLDPLIKSQLLYQLS